MEQSDEATAEKGKCTQKNQVDFGWVSSITWYSQDPSGALSHKFLTASKTAGAEDTKETGQGTPFRGFRV